MRYYLRHNLLIPTCRANIFNIFLREVIFHRIIATFFSLRPAYIYFTREKGKAASSTPGLAFFKPVFVLHIIQM